MDKYKILICGKQTSIIDDFFNHLSDDFDLLTTSFRYEDIVKHVSLFHPDVFILCLNGESKDDLNVMNELKRIFTRESIFVFIAGSREDCDFFRNTVVYMAEESFEKPISVAAIRNRINDYMDEKKKKAIEEEKLHAELEKIKEQNRRKHVLVIDDDPIMLKVVKEHLHENYDVATAISGKIAYKFLESKQTDIILLDYEMPGEDGPDVLINLRKRENLENTPLYF
ncbi:MAG: response regulator [Lachnospiraceae bacterium]|nr:response regulator [Lachnospiraceae bacterium]